MKKNVMMRVASALLVAVLLTTCTISGTFAKYTTEATGTDSARVAKFGVAITANGTTFAKEYVNDAKIGDVAAGAGVSVQSDVDVVAPGTKGTLANATIAGTPEVAVNVTYAAELTLSNWTVDGAEYCPVVIKVGDKTYGLTGMKDSNGVAVTNASASIAELETAVENAIAAYSADYAVGTDLSTAEVVNASWEWAFTQNDDAKDTKLGDAAAADATNAGSITLGITTTVTQID